MHKSIDCDQLQDMIENNGIYTLRKTSWEPGDPESSHSRSSLGETSLIFYDDQPPIGDDDLSYVPRRWELIEERDRLMGKPPEPFPPLFAAQISRQPAVTLRTEHAQPLASLTVSEPVQVCWDAEPPDKIMFDNNKNEIVTNLYKVNPIEDLTVNSLTQNFSLLKTIGHGNDTVVSNSYSYTNVNIDSGTNEFHLHNSVIPSVILPDICNEYNDATADN